MNRKQFGILLVLLIVLGGAGWLLQRGRDRDSNAGEQGTGQKLVGDSFPINDVTTISIQQDTNVLDLVKKDDLWRVSQRADYPANFSQISDFLIKIGDLKVIQNEDVGPSQLARLQLEPPGQGTNSGIVLDFKSKDGKSIRTLTLGKKHLRKGAPQPRQFSMGDEASADGRYVFAGSNTKNALLIADPLNNAEAKPDQWLRKDFFKIERPKAIAVTFSTNFTAATNAWKIVRDNETGDWTFADAKADEKLDQARASGVSNPFSSPSFNDVLPPTASGLDQPTIVTVDTFDDFTYIVKIGAKINDTYPITMTIVANFPKDRIPAPDEKPEDKTKADAAWKTRQSDLETKLKQIKAYENWIYLVPSWTVDPILKDRKDLIAEKKEESKPTDKPQSGLIEKNEDGLVTPDKPDATPK